MLSLQLDFLIFIQNPFLFLYFVFLLLFFGCYNELFLSLGEGCMVFTIGSELTDSGFPIFARNTYEKVEFFHVSRKNPYIQILD